LVASEISITVGYQFPFAQLISDPSGHLDVEGTVDVTYESMQGSVTSGRPFCDLGREIARGSKEVVPCHSGGVEDFHEDPSSDGLQFAFRLIFVFLSSGLNEWGSDFPKSVGRFLSQFEVSFNTRLEKFGHVMNDAFDIVFTTTNVIGIAIGFPFGST
jgi:hypothetical protein